MLTNITNFLLTKTPLFYWTQSLWRDEAFSVWIAQDSLTEVIRRTSGDYNPPLYYLLLHVWMRVFGRSEIALRSLSLVAFLITIYVTYLIGRQVFKKNHKFARYLMLLTATSPLLIYYAFELRMYAQFAMFASLSIYFLLKKKTWPYVLSTVLGLYTQPYMLFVVLTQNVYLWLKKEFKTLVNYDFLLGLFYLPWIPTLIDQLLASGPMWIWPIDLNLLLSVLGNQYVGFEGTPPWLWPYMKWLSVVFIIISAYVYIKSKHRDFTQFSLLLTYLPLTVVMGISLIKPIYVMRYVIFITLGEIFVISVFIAIVKNKNWQITILGVFLVLNIFLNLYMVPYHTKVDIRQTFAHIIPLLKPNDAVYAQTPLVYYESLYYTPDTYPVYLWNPNSIKPFRYVGGVGMPSSVWVNNYPVFPNRAFVIAEDGSYQIHSRL